MKYCYIILIAIFALGGCSSSQSAAPLSFQESLIKAHDKMKKAQPEHEIYELNTTFYDNNFSDYEVRFQSGTLGSQDIRDSQYWSYDMQDFEITFEEKGTGTLFSEQPQRPIDVPVFKQEPAIVIRSALQATGIAEEAVNIDEYTVHLNIYSSESLSEEIMVPPTQVWVVSFWHRELENHVVAVDAQTGEVLFQKKMWEEN